MKTSIKPFICYYPPLDCLMVVEIIASDGESSETIKIEVEEKVKDDDVIGSLKDREEESCLIYICVL